MKRLGAVLSLAVVIAMLACPFAYAAGLSVEHITPKDGETGKQPQNMAVKVRFNENVTSAEAQKENENRFKVTDPDGKAQEYVTIYDAEKYPNEVWLILQNDLVSDTEYKITIDKGFLSSSGKELGADYVTTFSTRNVKTDNNISMFMTLGMFVIMIFASTASAKKMAKQQQEEAIANKEEALNPYKIAKEKGISVEEAVAYIEKEKARAEKKRKKSRTVIDDDDEDEDDEDDRNDGAYHVKARRPISAVGAKTPDSIVRKNKKKRAARKAEEERRLAEMRARSAGKKKKK